ncbi:MAG: enoyl-CoA hydratase/isomerase family protein [Planctomycetota bacterium]|jgi:methylglutaconyl-CoA hydratase
MSSLVRLDVADGIATLTLNRPEKRNALSPELIDAAGEALSSIERDVSLRVMILAGAGRSFCAGMDLRGILDDAAAMGGMLHGLSLVMRRIRRLAIPTIARVQGAAVGGGCGLMVVTDFAITHPEAKVGYPEVDLGVCPAVVAPWLIRKIGSGPARAMLLAGGTMSGQAGFEAGLATHLADAAELEAAALALAQSLAQGGRAALSVTKTWLNELDGSMADAPLDRAAALSAEVIAGDEAQERLHRVLSG